MQHDIIPQDDHGFHNFQASLMKNATDNATAWHIPAEVLDLIEPLRVEWNEAWAKASDRANRTTSHVLRKDNARKKYKAMLRPFIQAYIRNNMFMTDSERTSCNIKARDRKPTRVQKPDTIPGLGIEINSGRELIIIFRVETGDEGSTSLAKPKGVARLELAYSIGTEPPYPKDCTNIITFSRNRHRLRNLHDEHHGKKIYFFARWVNTRNEPGPWSKRYMTIIP